MRVRLPMAESPQKPYVWERHSFAGRRWPRSRTARSFLTLMPWIDLMACGVLLFCVARQTVVQPGRVVELPEAALDEGLLARCPTAILQRLIAPGREDVTVLLLDDGRYSSDKPSELEALALTHPGSELNLIVDKAVPMGDALVWVERLRACGAKRVNLVAEPPQAEHGIAP